MKRALLLCGVISPLLYAVADALAGVVWEDYSFCDQTISELGAIGFAAAALGRGFATYTVATLAVMLMLLFGGWSTMEIPRVEEGLPTPWLGVKERIYWYSYHLWYIVLAVRLLREPMGTKEPA